VKHVYLEDFHNTITPSSVKTYPLVDFESLMLYIELAYPLVGFLVCPRRSSHHHKDINHYFMEIKQVSKQEYTDGTSLGPPELEAHG